MSEKHSTKFWIIFWSISILFLIGWYFFLQVKNRNFQMVETAIDFLPVGQEDKIEWKALSAFADWALKKDDQEKTFLILFQNNMEIRPGGGFIGAFGILKIKNGQVLEMQTHDLSNFDARIPNGIPTPYPMWETLRVKDWKLRDSNFSPDFAVNARKAEEFYYLGQGQEKFDGIVGVTTNVLTSFLKATGPVVIEGYPGEYGDENAVLALEYQVEKGFDDQGVPRGDRKVIMNDLAKAIIQKVLTLSNAQKLELAQIIMEDLGKKDIQLYFHDSNLENEAVKAGWSGTVDQNWNKDYLDVSDANLGAYKSDYYVKRSFDYSIDLSKDAPEAVLKITYNHTGKQKDWMTKDYVDFVRVYAPNGAWLQNESAFGKVIYGSDLNKKSFGALIFVPLGATKTFEFRYILPKELKDNYDLKIQKQAGINDAPVAVHVVGNNGNIKDYGFVLNSDKVLSDIN